MTLWLQGFVDKLGPDLSVRFAALLGVSIVLLLCCKLAQRIPQSVTTFLYQDWHEALHGAQAKQSYRQATWQQSRLLWATACS